jgi:small subunit ribosomal protein S6
MSSNYELMYILRPDLTEEQVQQEVGKYQSLLNDYNAENISSKTLGKRRLAYPIKKYTDGVYVQVNYSGDGKQVAPLERSMRLSDEVIRYLTTKLKDVNIPVVEETEPAAVVEAPAVVVEAPAPIATPVEESPEESTL